MKHQKILSLLNKANDYKLVTRKWTFTFSKSDACLLNVEPSESVFLKT